MFDPLDELNLGGDVTSSVGLGTSVPYVDLAKSAYNLYKDPVRGLMSPSTPMLAAKTIGALGPGLASGAGGTMTGMGAVLAAIIMSHKMGLWGKGSGQGMNPFKDPAAFAMTNVGSNPDYTGGYKLLKSKLPDGKALAQRFRAQTGYKAPSADSMPNLEATVYQNWMAKQPEYQKALEEYYKQRDESWEYKTHEGSEGEGPRWVKKNTGGLMGSYDSTIG